MVLDYGIRTSLRVRQARRRLDLLVLDRYWHDVIVDLSAGGEMAKPPRLLTLLLPRPDLVLVLELPEEEAIVRQPDALDLTHLRQRRRLYGMVANQPDAALVDASGTEATSATRCGPRRCPACGGARMSGQPLIILGVDGLDWAYVDAHRDELPTLAGWPQLSLCARSSRLTRSPLGRRSSRASGPGTTASWTRSTTCHAGRRARPRPRGRRSRADVLGQGRRAGAKVCVINPFLAHPAWDVNGLMVSGPVFVSGEVSVTGRDLAELGPVPSLGGIVDFPTTDTMGPFIDDTLAATQEQSDFGLRMLDLTGPDLFFLNVLTLDRLQHFVWRFADPDDPTYPGPNPHGKGLLESYRMIDRIAADYAERGRVLVISDHGHGMRPSGWSSSTRPCGEPGC